MECSSDESSELSDTDINDYAEKSYMDLKAGKLVARLGNDRFRCPFCPGKKKQDYRYSELLQHAVGMGASNRAAKVKANHQALANLLKIDYADAAGSLPSRQVVAPSNPPRPMQDQELFVWPWMGILANVPAEQTKGGGAILMRQLAEFNPLQFNVVYCSKGYTGFAVVRFTKDWIGFKNALAFQNYLKSKRLGKMDWNETNQQGKYIYGWLAKEEDYKSDDPVGKFLSENGVLSATRQWDPGILKFILLGVTSATENMPGTNGINARMVSPKQITQILIMMTRTITCWVWKYGKQMNL